MFEICPPSQNPFLYAPSNVMVSFSCMQVCFSPLFHPSGRRMAVQLHFSSEKRCCSFPLSVVHFVCGHFQHVQFFIMFLFICDVYVTNAFRTSVYGTFICELPTMGSCAVSSLLPFMALLLTLMVLFYVKGNKEKKRRRRHRHVSPSADAVDRTRRRKPPSDSGDEGDRKATGREEVWIKVPLASLTAR